MNEQILKGNWKQAKGRIKEAWGKLTDDELEQIEGNYERLIGKVQEHYGYKLDEARSKVNNLLTQLNSKI